MFEVSWCVGLYVTVLALEFMPVAFERWGVVRAMERWKTAAPLWVVAAVTLWGVSVGLVAATVFLFGWAARNMPVLPKQDEAQGAGRS